MIVPKQIGRYFLNIADNHLLIQRSGIFYLIETSVRAVFGQQAQPWRLVIAGTRLSLKLTEQEKEVFHIEREMHEKIIAFGNAIDVMRYPPSVQK